MGWGRSHLVLISTHLLASLGQGGILHLGNPILLWEHLMVPSAVPCGPMKPKNHFKDETLRFREVRGLPEVAQL